MIRVVNKKDASHSGTTVYIGRPTILGNPFPLNGEASRKRVIEQYELWLKEQINYGNRKVIDDLKRLKSIHEEGELNLQCFCAPRPCHGDVIKKAILYWDI